MGLVIAASALLAAGLTALLAALAYWGVWAGYGTAINYVGIPATCLAFWLIPIGLWSFVKRGPSAPR